MVRLAAAFAAAFLLSAPAHAEEPFAEALREILKALEPKPECMGLTEFKDLMTTEHVAYDVLNADRQVRFLALLEDQSIADEHWSIVVLGLDDSGTLFAALGRNGQVCKRLNLSEESHKPILNGVYGVRV